MFNFTPDDPGEDNSKSDLQRIHIPFVEDARADIASKYASRKSIDEAMGEIEDKLARLGGALVKLRSGTFDVNGQVRIGYMLVYRWMGAMGFFAIAGLPMRNRTDAKERQVRVQALLHIAGWLDACYFLRVFSPDSEPLLLWMQGENGKRVMDVALESGMLPMLSASKDVIEAEFTDA
jgi:hypothetical protein